MTADTPNAASKSRLAAWLDRPLIWRDALLLFAFALALRLVNVWSLTGVEGGFEFGDSGEYLTHARAWLETGNLAGYLTGEIVLPMERNPGYFWFLSGVFSLFGWSLAAAAIVQGVLDAGTCVLIAALAMRLGPAPARLAGLSAALWPNLIIHSALMLQDTLFLFLLTALLLAIVEFARRPGLGRAALVGFLFGASYLVRSVIQFLPLIVAGTLAGLAWWRRRGPAVTTLSPVVFLLVMLVPLSPLAWRNVTVFDTVQPSAQSGLHALFWTVSLVRMDQHGTTFDVEAKKTQARFADFLEARGIDRDKLNAFEIDRLRRELAFAELLATPPLRLAKVWVQGAAINLLSPSVLSDARVRALPRPSFYQTGGKGLFERAWRYFFADPGWFQVIVLIGLAASLLGFALQAWGLFALFRYSRLAAAGAVLFLAYFLAISGPTAGPKYRMPMEPVLIVLFGLGLERAVRRIVRRREAGRP